MNIAISNISKEYERGNHVTKALNNINLQIQSGEFVAIIGPSGSGKTTLLSLIAGVLNPTGGKILWDDTDIGELRDKEISRLRNNNIGVIPQGHSLLQNLTVWDNVRLPFYLDHREGNPDDIAEELLKELGIFHLRNEYPDSLSGGEMRRTAIARALINQPEVVLADEPTGDLDEENTREIISIFRSLAGRGTSVVIVTHDVDSIEGMGTIYRMSNGELLDANSIKIA